MITPGGFDPVTAREMVGDTAAREIEAKARADADKETWDPPPATDGTYMTRVFASMRAVLYREQYGKRLARNQRKKER